MSQAQVSAPAKRPARPRRPLFASGRGRVAGVLLLLSLLVVVGLVSLRVGSVPMETRTVVDALVAFDGSDEHVIVRDIRLPRTLVGLVVGVALALAGGVMQAVTRNPLAEPGILGVNAGAAFAVVTAVYALGVVSPAMYMWFAFAGAAAASVVVYLLGSGRGGPQPVRLALAGVVVTLLLDSWITLIMVFNERTLDEVRFWLAGSIAGREWSSIAPLLPILGLGVVAGVVLARQLNALSLGDQIAATLGQRTTLVRAGAGLVVVVLAGGAVAVAGPIGFVGLAVPHIARLLTGPDYRWIQTYALLLGPLVLLGADILGRVVARPAEIQVGIITAILGAPLLIYVARRRKLPSV